MSLTTGALEAAIAMNDKIFSQQNRIGNIMLERVALKAMLKALEFEGFEGASKCCPVCGGNQSHDSACVLAAFLYPEKAESYKRNTKDTHINEMLWQIGNDERFAFLREELAAAQNAGVE